MKEGTKTIERVVHPPSRASLAHSLYVALPWLILALACGCFVFQLAAQAHGTAPRAFDDTLQYLTQSTWSASELRFYLAPRPISYPLFIKILRGNPVGITQVQLLLYVSIWLAIAWIAFNHLGRRIAGAVAAAFLTYVASSVGLTIWNPLLLTEALSNVALLAWVLLWLGFIRYRGNGWLLSLLIVTSGYAQLRDVNAYQLLLFAPLFGFYAYVSRDWLKSTIGAVACAAVAITSIGTANHTLRWELPFLNVLGKRILVDPSRQARFADLGMPLTPALLEWTDRYAYEKAPNMLADPRLSDLRAWVELHGKGAYARFLATDPRYTVGSLWRDRRIIFDASGDEYGPYAAEGFGREGFWGRSIGLRHACGVALLLSLVGAALCRFRRMKFDALVLTSGVWLALTSLPLFLLCYHGDANEIARHSLPALLALAVGLCLSTFAVWRPLIVRVDNRGATGR